MLKSLVTSRVLHIGLGLVAVYLIGRLSIGLDLLIPISNALVVGSFCALVLLYAQLIWVTVLDRHGRYDRSSQMALGVGVMWIAVAITVLNSIFVRASGAPVVNTELTAVSRFIATIGALLQVMAPEVGSGQFFIHRDKATIYAAAAVGVCVAVAAMIYQGPPGPI